MFVENIHKTSSRPTSTAASRRNSMSSINQSEVPIVNELQSESQKDLKKPVSAKSSFRSPKKSTSSLGRTESYRHARGDFGADYEGNDQDEYAIATGNLGTRAGKDRNKKYNSLPRLGSRRREEKLQTDGGLIHPTYHSRPNSRGGPSKVDDQCALM